MHAALMLVVIVIAARDKRTRGTQGPIRWEKAQSGQVGACENDGDVCRIRRRPGLQVDRGAHSRYRWIPHSCLSVPGHRPERRCAPGITGTVVGAQPIDVYPTEVSGWTNRLCSAT